MVNAPGKTLTTVTPAPDVQRFLFSARCVRCTSAVK